MTRFPAVTRVHAADDVSWIGTLRWPAVIAGAVIALGIQLVFTLFGVGIGMAMSDVRPVGETPNMPGMAAVMWLIVSGVVSFGAGGWVAGQLSGVFRNGSGALNGIAAWASAAVLGVIVSVGAGSSLAAGLGVGAGSRVMNSDATALPGSVGSRTTLPDGSVRLNDAYGRVITEVDARAAAEVVRQGAARTALWTGVAFLLSMIAAGVGGAAARASSRVVHTRESMSAAQVHA